MRVTSGTFPQTLVSQLNQLSIRQNRLQNQAATGQRVQLPEDDPTAMRRVLDLQNEFKSLGQFKENVERLKEQANASFSAMNALKKLSDRAGEIATLADGTKSRDQLNAYASEVTQMLHQAVQLANTKHRGDFLFAGTLSDQKPFEPTVNASGQITGVAFNGNTSVPEVEVSEGVTVSAHVPGANTTGSGSRGLLADSRYGSDFFAHLISLQNNLLAGNTGAINTTDRTNLENDEENFIFHFGTNGAMQARLEATLNSVSSRSASIEKLVSHEADADLAQTLVRLNETQNAYRAALQSGGSIISQSLLDYLR